MDLRANAEVCFPLLERGLEAARKARLTVAHVMVGHDEFVTLKTTRAAGSDDVAQVLQLAAAQTRICREVEPQPGEPVIVKGWVDPFVATPLDALLRNRQVDTLFLGGVTTNHAVESAARHASDLGYFVKVVEDMCASMTQEMHEVAINTGLPVFADAISIEDFLEHVGQYFLEHVGHSR